MTGNDRRTALAILVMLTSSMAACAGAGSSSVGLAPSLVPATSTSTTVPPSSTPAIGGSASASAGPGKVSAARWAATGSLIEPRSEHAAVRLADGRVLVVGGNAPGTPAAELYDPVAGTWSATGPMITTRARPTTTLLPNGTVLVAGGVGDSDRLASAEIFDPAKGTWTATGSMADARDSTWPSSWTAGRCSWQLAPEARRSTRRRSSCMTPRPARGPSLVPWPSGVRRRRQRCWPMAPSSSRVALALASRREPQSDTIPSQGPGPRPER